MTATATTTNGPAKRKQLSDQLDRMDGIIDALAEALPEAVADATREGARQAVRDVILELLGNPELRAMIAGMAPAARPAAPEMPAEPAPARPGIWSRLKARIAAARDAAARRIKAAVGVVMTTARTLAAVLPLRKILLVGAGVGLAVGLVSYASPHAVSAVVSGVGGACTAVAAQVGSWFRRSVDAFGLAGTS